MTRRWRVRRTGWRTVEIRPAAGLGSLVILLGMAGVGAGMLAALIPRVWAWAGAHPGTTALAVVALVALIYAASPDRRP